MNPYLITPALLAGFAAHLRAEERSPGTISKYLCDMRAFAGWLDGRPAEKALTAAWREHLLENGCCPVTVNGKLTAVNAFFRFAGWEGCRVHFLKLQRQLFREDSRELTRAEYQRLLSTAQARGQERLALLIETICSTGIRVSEVPYITLEAARQGRAEIALKGKRRVILLPERLCRKLKKYAKTKKIASGELFITKSGRGVSRKQIWAEMKALCAAANVAESKVFPHNLRHLFARCYYRVSRDVAGLADVLGHSSIETTRIYLISTGAEHARQLEQLGLVT